MPKRVSQPEVGLDDQYDWAGDFKNQEYRVVPIDVVEEHPDNPNTSDEDLIEESIETHGFYGAILVQESTNYIVAGNHRWRVAKRRGQMSIPVIFREMSDETALQVMLVDNESTRRGHVQQAKVDAILETLGPLASKGTGYDLDALEQHEQTLIDTPEGEYEERYGVIVECKSEQDQENIYEHLKSVTVGVYDVEIRVITV